MKADKYIQEYTILKDSIIKDIFSLLEKANAGNISLKTGIIYNFIDDQMNEIVKEIEYSTRSVVIDGNTYDYTIPIYEIPVDILCSILETIELEDYEIFEELN